MDDQGRINYPDLQIRLFKLHQGIVWTQKVHETLINYKRFGIFPYHLNEKYCLYHHKTIQKQEKQNKYYDSLQ